MDVNSLILFLLCKQFHIITSLSKTINFCMQNCCLGAKLLSWNRTPISTCHFMLLGEDKEENICLPLPKIKTIISMGMKICDGTSYFSIIHLPVVHSTGWCKNIRMWKQHQWQELFYLLRRNGECAFSLTTFPQRMEIGEVALKFFSLEIC